MVVFVWCLLMQACISVCDGDYLCFVFVWHFVFCVAVYLWGCLYVFVGTIAIYWCMIGVWVSVCRCGSMYICKCVCVYECF